MNAIEHAHQILDTMLGYLGFAVQIEDDENGPEGPTLQILTEDADALIGRHGETLDDIQYLVNRILIRHLPGAPRIRVDAEYYRSMAEDKLVQHVKEQAQRVRVTGRSVTLNPMNSYYRRIVHNTLVNDPEVMSISSNDPSTRYKRIILRRRPSATSSQPEQRGSA